MARHQQRHITGWPAVLLLPIALPVVLLVKLGEATGLLKATKDLNAEDVEAYLRDFLEERGGDWDWDDFTSIPISDPLLDSIREEAAGVEFPLTADGYLKLTALLQQVEDLRTWPVVSARGWKADIKMYVSIISRRGALVSCC